MSKCRKKEEGGDPKGASKLKRENQTAAGESGGRKKAGKRTADNS